MLDRPTEELIRRCRSRDSRAQKALYDRYAGRMMAVCLRYAPNRESAQDLLQEGFIKLFGALESYRGEGSFDGWVHRIFVNTALAELRKNDLLRQSAPIEEDRNAIDEADYSTLDRISADELTEVIASLPDGFRTVFNLFAVEGYSHKEIGEMLRITESTSRSQYTRAKQALQKKLETL